MTILEWGPWLFRHASPAWTSRRDALPGAGFWRRSCGVAVRGRWVKWVVYFMENPIEHIEMDDFLGAPHHM